ncbi:MAG: hypothetical protein GC171_12130 [Terrimonas sp.]|nr:hypothetical protein [Terrimonas sp.]
MSVKVKTIFFLVMMLSGFLPPSLAQKNIFPADSSVLAAVRFGENVFLDKRGLFTRIAKTTLEMESGTGSLNEIEVLVWENKNRKKQDAVSWLEREKMDLKKNGWTIVPSARDTSFSKLLKTGKTLVMYMAAGKLEANLYFGKLIAAEPVAVTNPAARPVNKNDTVIVIPAVTDTVHTVKAAKGKGILGNWGDISGPKVNYFDDNTGYMVGSGLSKGDGYEFKEDGTFNRYFLATSSRPDYRIFLYEKGTYNVSGNKLTLTPIDLYYRKWEDDQMVTNEHSVPAVRKYRWSIQPEQYTGKPCLHLQPEGGGTEQHYCSN